MSYLTIFMMFTLQIFKGKKIFLLPTIVVDTLFSVWAVVGLKTVGTRPASQVFFFLNFSSNIPVQGWVLKQDMFYLGTFPFTLYTDNKFTN